MKMALTDGILRIRELSDEQYQVFISFGRFKWSKALKELSGPCDLDTLNRVKTVTRLPVPIEAERQRLQNIQDAVDKIRLDPDPKPLRPMHLKKGIKPYAHQVRAFNMALLVMEIAEPAEVLNEQR